MDYKRIAYILARIFAYIIVKDNKVEQFSNYKRPGST